MEKYQIIIKNRATGEVLVDVNTNAIIGAVDTGATTRVLGLINCEDRDLAATAAGALQAANRAIASLPRSLAKITRKIGKKSNRKTRRAS
jgi:hypothetical protein